MGRSGRAVGVPSRRLCPLAAEEPGPEPAVLEGVQLGLEPYPVLREGGLLLCELGVLLDHAAAVLLEPPLLLFEGRDGLLLQLALELDEVQALYLRPEAVYLHAGGVPLLADLLDLAASLLEAGVFVSGPPPGGGRGA